MVAVPRCTGSQGHDVPRMAIIALGRVGTRPTLVGVTLFCMLFFSGIGSLTANRLPAERSAALLKLVIPLIVLLVTTYAVAIRWLFELLAPEHTVLRILAVILVTAPMSFLMGMPFPSKVRTLTSPRAVSWAWAINAFVSVNASVIAVIISMQLGFQATFLVGAGAYVMTLIAHLRS